MFTIKLYIPSDTETIHISLDERPPHIYEIEELRKEAFHSRCEIDLTRFDPVGDVTSVKTLDLGVKIDRCFAPGGIETIDDLLECPREDLLKIRALGDLGIDEIAEAMYQRGYKDNAASLIFPKDEEKRKEFIKDHEGEDTVLGYPLGYWLYRAGVKTKEQLRGMKDAEIIGIKKFQGPHLKVIKGWLETAEETAE